jgi:hypothetical protein
MRHGSPDDVEGYRHWLRRPPGISPRRTSQGGVAIHVIPRQHYLGAVPENN